MMDWTDRHDRFFLRLLSRHTRLYTEMVTEQAIRFGDRARLLDFDAAEHPLALQLGIRIMSTSINNDTHERVFNTVCMGKAKL